MKKKNISKNTLSKYFPTFQLFQSKTVLDLKPIKSGLFTLPNIFNACLILLQLYLLYTGLVAVRNVKELNRRLNEVDKQVSLLVNSTTTRGDLIITKVYKDDIQSSMVTPNDSK